jgi:transposase InsO family protein
MEAMHAVEALEEAFAKHGQPEIVNTDQGSQFTATVFTEGSTARQPRTVQPTAQACSSHRETPRVA